MKYIILKFCRKSTFTVGTLSIFRCCTLWKISVNLPPVQPVCPPLSDVGDSGVGLVFQYFCCSRRLRGSRGSRGSRGMHWRNHQNLTFKSGSIVLFRSFSSSVLSFAAVRQFICKHLNYDFELLIFSVIYRPM